MEQVLDGKLVSQRIKDAVRKKIKEGNIQPGLTVILVGSDKPSETYVEQKIKACREVGITSTVLKIPDTTTEKQLIDIINKLNQDVSVHGILVQLPLPGHLHVHEQLILEAIHPDKDVDGLHPINLGRFINNKYLQDNTILLPCTPYGVIRLLDAYDIPMEGKKVVVIGRSNLVGKPLGMLFLSKSATVTFCHSKTKDLKQETLTADILATAIGKPHFIDASYIKQGAVIIDIGFNYSGGVLTGDVDYQSVEPKAFAITPVPGGVGQMTVAILMENVLHAFQKQTRRT